MPCCESLSSRSGRGSFIQFSAGVGKLPLQVTPGTVLRDPLLAGPSLCLPPNACFIWLPLLTSVAWWTNAALEGRRVIWGAPSLSSLCFPLTWALCEIFLWPPVEGSQPPLDNVRTCLDLPTKHKSENHHKRNFKFDNCEELGFLQLPPESYIFQQWLWGLWVFKYQRWKNIIMNKPESCREATVGILGSNQKWRQDKTWIHSYDHRRPWWFW